MLVIALTGGIGSGKTAAADEFNRLGVPVIDTDAIARELTTSSSTATQEIRKHFGDGILQPSGELDRNKLRKLVFSDSAKRKLLESILHPLIRQEVARRLQDLDAEYCIVVIPLLVETDQHNDFARVLVIDCPKEMQIARVIQRNALGRDEVEDIMKAQASREQRLQAADDVIENTGSPEQLREQVRRLHNQYRILAKR